MWSSPADRPFDVLGSCHFAVVEGRTRNDRERDNREHRGKKGRHAPLSAETCSCFGSCSAWYSGCTNGSLPISVGKQRSRL